MPFFNQRVSNPNLFRQLKSPVNIRKCPATTEYLQRSLACLALDNVDGAIIAVQQLLSDTEFTKNKIQHVLVGNIARDF